MKYSLVCIMIKNNIYRGVYAYHGILIGKGGGGGGKEEKIKK